MTFDLLSVLNPVSPPSQYFFVCLPLFLCLSVSLSLSVSVCLSACQPPPSRPTSHPRACVCVRSCVCLYVRVWRGGEVTNKSLVWCIVPVSYRPSSHCFLAFALHLRNLFNWKIVLCTTACSQTAPSSD